MTKFITRLMIAAVMMIPASSRAQCDAPTGLAATYNNNVTHFSWNGVIGVVDYTIEIKQASDSWTSAEVIQTVPGNSFDLTGIFHSASIDWRVSANCGSAASAYTVASFTIPCPVPTGLNVTNITAGGATLNWTPAAGYNTFISDFLVAYRLGGTTNSWTQIGHTQASTINVTGLNPNTPYEWSVTQTCPYFNSSAVFGQFSTALPTCATPTNVTFTYNNNVSTFTWNAVPGVTNYKVQLGWAGAPWGTVEQTVGASPYIVTNLMQGGNFQFRVRANCGNSYSYYAPILFSTPCSAPGSLTTTNITSTGATLNWVPAIGNNNNTVFSIGYRVAGTNNAWSNVGSTTASSINVTGLTPGISYQWCVTKICSAINSSPVIAQFATANNNCSSSGSNSAEWIDLFQLGSINRVSGAEAGGYVNAGMITNLTIGSLNNAGQISAGFSGTVRNQTVSIYIDLNRNGSYADANEKVAGPFNVSGTGTTNFSVSIPSNATAGVAGMRVIMRRANGNITGCLTGFNGETEDYTVNLVTSGSFSSTNNMKTEMVSETVETNNSIVVSPNPSQGLYEIFMPDASSQYEIRNTNGNLIQQKMMSDANHISIDIRSMPDGLYMLRITSRAGKQQVLKLIKQ